MRRVSIHKTKAVGRARKTKRPIGLAKKKLRLTKSFFKPLPDELLDSFEGNS